MDERHKYHSYFLFTFPLISPQQQQHYSWRYEEAWKFFVLPCHFTFVWLMCKGGGILEALRAFLRDQLLLTYSTRLQLQKLRLRLVLIHPCFTNLDNEA